MQEFPYVLSEYEEINPLLYKPINSTQRIKYTCFNVSASYIILGSTSGSIYLFSRKPCSFVQLIPLSEGAVSRVLISPDEKTIALTTNRGIVCLVALKPTPKLIAVSSEHVQEQINCLCWNDNSSEIYVGDGNGKISVMVLSIFTVRNEPDLKFFAREIYLNASSTEPYLCFLTSETGRQIHSNGRNALILRWLASSVDKVNGMFQGPACTLMNLDSAVVQLSFSSPLLLASTLTRCYICDTVQEQYKQVGNKGRNGEFGACFYKTYLTENKSTSVTQKDEKLVNRKGSFNFIPEGNGKVQEENFPQIFCARPGSRLWEVSVNGIVLKTHQFKEALGVPPVTICKQNVRKLVHQKQTEQNWLPQSINFSHLSIVTEKYLFSYTSTGLYIIDPVSASVVLWNNEFANICGAETIENKIYLMTSDGEFRCLILSFLDSLILWLYNKKKYYECLEICLMYKTQLKNFVNDSEINNISDIENKLQILRNDELSTLLHPLMLLLESASKVIPKKLDSGIVVVKHGNLDLREADRSRHNSVAHSSMQNHTTFFNVDLRADTEMLANSPNDPINEAEDANCNTAEEIDEKTNEISEATEEEKLSSDKSVMQKIQTDLEGIYALVDNIRPSMDEEELEKIITDIDWRMDLIKDSYETLTDLRSFILEVLRSVELYYFNVLLENISMQLIQSTDNENIAKQIVKAFINVNAQSYRMCTCGSPYSTNELMEPKFLGIGRSLLKKMFDQDKEQCISLCNKVPYLWRVYLPLYIEHNGILMNDLLRQCLQIRDSLMLSILLPLLDGKHWNIVASSVKEMQDGHCLFCGMSVRKGNNEALINWSAVIFEIMKKQGPDIAMALLVKLEKSVPNVPIDRSIFQSMIFTKLLYQHGMKYAINFNKSNLESSEYNTMCSTKIRDQLVEVLEKDLKKPVNKSSFGNGPHHWGMHYQNKLLSTCPCCTLSLQTPVLLGNNGIAIFDCGHAYHVNCMIEKKLTACNLNH